MAVSKNDLYLASRRPVHVLEAQDFPIDQRRCSTSTIRVAAVVRQSSGANVTPENRIGEF